MEKEDIRTIKMMKFKDLVLKEGEKIDYNIIVDMVSYQDSGIGLCFPVEEATIKKFNKRKKKVINKLKKIERRVKKESLKQKEELKFWRMVFQGFISMFKDYKECQE